MEYRRRILITGGASFIGSHLVCLFIKKYPDYQIINLDNLTYRRALEKLSDIHNKPNYKFINADIIDYQSICKILRDYTVDGIIHLGAESHINGINESFVSAEANMTGTLSLLLAAKNYWQNNYNGKRFCHISLNETSYPTNSDQFVRAFYDTYGFPTVLTNCSSNYGPYQSPEKLIPLFIYNILNCNPLPIYGRGENVRDWLHVEDQVRAIDRIFHKGELGDSYNIRGGNTWKDIDMVKMIIRMVDKLTNKPEGTSDHLITYVTDYTGYDLRHTPDSSVLKRELGWAPSLSLEEGIEKTIKWYLENKKWLENIEYTKYQEYKQSMYQ